MYVTPTVGDKFGPYEILGRLGRGGMGLVYRAWDGRLHREVESSCSTMIILRRETASGFCAKPEQRLR